MPRTQEMIHRLERSFTQEQAEVLAEVISEAYDDVVKAGDFNELKEIVRELAQAQTRTEHAVEKLTLGMEEMRREVGGLSRSVGYALENDAYRLLPAFLAREHGLRVTDRFVRTEIAGEKINFLAHAEKSDGTPMMIVGESKSRLDERRRALHRADLVLDKLAEKVAAASRAHPGLEVVPLLVTHYARPVFLKAAQARGVIVVQSFELA